MKRAYRYAASALLSAFLMTGLTQAALAENATAAKPAVQEAVKAPAKPQGAQPLSEEKMKLVKESMTKMREEVKPLFSKEMSLRKELHALMIADTFDKAAYLSKHEEAQTVHQQIADIRANAIANVAISLTAEERRELPRAMMMRGPKAEMMQGHKGKGMGMRGPKGARPEGEMMKDNTPADTKAAE